MTLKVKAVRVNELEPGHSTPHPHRPSYGAVSLLRGQRVCTHTHTHTHTSPTMASGDTAGTRSPSLDGAHTPCR